MSHLGEGEHEGFSFQEKVCQHEAQNKMTASNLSLIWAMTLFQPLQIDVGSPTEIDITSLQNAR
ncbi:hypothetical protein ACTXT7_001310, partial [Hymenolepis weldensis]